MDWILQKSVELGVAWIQPVVCDRSVVRLSGDRAARREAHWQRVVDRRLRAVRPQPACRNCGPRSAFRDWAAPALGGRALDARARSGRARSPRAAAARGPGGAAGRPRGRAFRSASSTSPPRSASPPLSPGPARAAHRNRPARRACRDAGPVGRLPPVESASRPSRPADAQAPRTQDRSLREVVPVGHALHPPVGRGDVRHRLRRRGAGRRRVPAAHARHQRAREPGGARGAGARHAPAGRGADAPARRGARATWATGA